MIPFTSLLTVHPPQRHQPSHQQEQPSRRRQRSSSQPRRHRLRQQQPLQRPQRHQRRGENHPGGPLIHHRQQGGTSSRSLPHHLRRHRHRQKPRAPRHPLHQKRTAPRKGRGPRRPGLRPAQDPQPGGRVTAPARRRQALAHRRPRRHGRAAVDRHRRRCQPVSRAADDPTRGWCWRVLWRQGGWRGCVQAAHGESAGRVLREQRH